MDEPRRLEWNVHDDPPEELKIETHAAAGILTDFILKAMNGCPYDPQVTYSAFLSATGTVLGICLETMTLLTPEESEQAMEEYGTFLTKFLRKWGEVSKDRLPPEE
jgi:hypothetical protein